MPSRRSTASGRPGVGDVADRRIEPDVEHLAFRTFDGHRDTPIEVAGHGTRTQTAVEPRLALPIDVRTPLFVFLEDPLLKPLLVLIKRQIPMGSGFLNERIARLGVIGVDELFGRKGRTALLALVAIGAEAVAVRTFATDITVGEEVTGLGVLELLGGLLDELAVVVELA